MTQSFNTAADANARITPDVTAGYFRAAEQGDAVKVTAYLDKYPALLESKDNPTGATAVVLASMEGHAEVVKLLHKRGANLKASDNGDQSGLFYAGYNGHREVAQYIIDNGVSATVPNRAGMSAVTAARANDFVSFADELVRMNDRAVLQIRVMMRDMLRHGAREDLTAPPTAVFKRKPR